MRVVCHVGMQMLLLYYVISNVVYALLLVIASLSRSKHRFRQGSMRLSSLKRSPFLAPISVIVPARNEERTIVAGVQALLELDYPDLEIIVVNDGSNDSTLACLQESFALRPARLLYVSEVPTAPVRDLFLSRSEPRLIVLSKDNGGCKADAVNAGINVATRAFVCIIDADSILESDALLRIMSAVHSDTASVIAAGGIVRVVNGCEVERGRIRAVRLPRGHLEMLQVIEYLRSFLVGRDGWARLDMLPIISGAFGVFRTQLVREIGGLRRDAIGEDLDLVVRLHRRMRERREKYRIAFIPDPACWTEVPRDMKSLGRQRARWHQGLFQVLWQNRDMLFRRRYGRIGFIQLPYLWLFELLAPVLQLLGYVSLVMSAMMANFEKALFFQILLFGYCFSTLISIAAILLEEVTYRRYQRWRDVARLILYCLIEQFPYQVIHIGWRLRGLFQHLTGKGPWHQIQRIGFARPSASTSSFASGVRSQSPVSEHQDHVRR